MGWHLAADSLSTLFLAISAGAALASYAPPPTMLKYSYSQTACFSLCPERFSLRYSHCLLPYFTQHSGQRPSCPPLTTLLHQLCCSPSTAPLPLHPCPLITPVSFSMSVSCFISPDSFYCLIILFVFNVWLCWVFWLLLVKGRLSLVAVNGGYSSLQCVGFSLGWLLLFWSAGSGVHAQ